MISSSTPNCKGKCHRFIAGIIAGVLLITGCEGPSTAVLSGTADEGGDENVRVSSIVPASSAERLMETVNVLCSGGSIYDGEESGQTGASTDPSVYIVSSLRSLSYDVAQSGEIIEAVHKADGDDCDVCLFIACYGGSGAGTCASATAAGAAVLLEIAENLSEISGDTEVRLVFLPGERSDTKPIYTYLSELYAPDPERLLGAVVMGALGLGEASENELGCTGGEPTFMAQQISRVCQDYLGSDCVCMDSSEGVQNVLTKNNIPSVVYSQRRTADAGTVLDCPSIIDYGYLADSADILCRTLALLLGEDTPSMRARAHYTDDPLMPGSKTFAWEDDLFSQFGRTEQDFETASGFLGGQISENVMADGSELTGYRFSFQWFGTDELIPTDLYYLADSLQDIRIRAAEEGLAFDAVCDEISLCYGESTHSSQGPYGEVFEWVLPMRRVCITLTPQKEDYDLDILAYDTPDTLYPSDSLGADVLKGIFEQVIPEKDRENISFEAYTDGYGGTLGRIGRIARSSGGSSWILGLDQDDALTKSAGYKDRMQTVGELLLLYGEYLAEEDASLYYNAYNSRFGGDTGDFAASFCLFAQAGIPQEEAGPAADPVRFFYDFDELVSFRDTVRGIR